MTKQLQALQCLVLICLVSFACSSRPDDQPELGEVTGIVTLDGEPLEDVLVQFSPLEGRGSESMTDSDGKYELIYVYPTKGAKVGKHKVTIRTPPVDDSDPEAPEIEEIIPAKYHLDSTLTAEVKAERNQINFELKSD